jgi:hypothetical protein
MQLLLAEQLDAKMDHVEFTGVDGSEIVVGPAGRGRDERWLSRLSHPRALYCSPRMFSRCDASR